MGGRCWIWEADAGYERQREAMGVCEIQWVAVDGCERQWEAVGGCEM